ncbi:MAG: hypothetical protein FJ096_22665 [Deltaproteobacteria bacterium]|nr:hypothetical protein [Deltaproteobacteria bacterium]
MKRHQAIVTLPLLGLALAVGCSQSSDDEQVGTLEAAVKPARPGTGSGGGPTGKVSICPIPPGNPANAHTVEVGAAAVDAHLAQGDVLGACPSEGAGGQGGACPNGSASSVSVTSSTSGSGAGGDMIEGPQR